MNLRNTPPDLPDRWRGTVMDCCRVLGREDAPIDTKTFRRWTVRLRVPSHFSSARGREVFTGKDINRLWYCLT